MIPKECKRLVEVDFPLPRFPRTRLGRSRYGDVKPPFTCDAWRGNAMQLAEGIYGPEA